MRITVSPFVWNLFREFPASLIVTGTRDLLLSIGVPLFWKLRAANVKAELLVGEGMWHGYHWEYEMPESVMTMKGHRRFLRTPTQENTLV